jgi:hypothetical protein
MLENLGCDFLGLEKDDVLGGRIVVGHHRIYSEASVQFFKRMAPEIPWTLYESSPFLRKKGDWEELLSETESHEDEKF